MLRYFCDVCEKQLQPREVYLYLNGTILGEDHKPVLFPAHVCMGCQGHVQLPKEQGSDLTIRVCRVVQ